MSQDESAAKGVAVGPEHRADYKFLQMPLVVFIDFGSRYLGLLIVMGVGKATHKAVSMLCTVS
jgi:hypothetical protein